MRVSLAARMWIASGSRPIRKQRCRHSGSGLGKSRAAAPCRGQRELQEPEPHQGSQNRPAGSAVCGAAAPSPCPCPAPRATRWRRHPGVRRAIRSSSPSTRGAGVRRRRARHRALAAPMKGAPRNGGAATAARGRARRRAHRGVGHAHPERHRARAAAPWRGRGGLQEPGRHNRAQESKHEMGLQQGSLGVSGAAKLRLEHTAAVPSPEAAGFTGRAPCRLR